MIPFVQFMRPNGEQRPTSIERSAEITAMAQQLIDHGARFTVEELMTGMISVACELDDEDIWVAISANGPPVLDAVDNMIRSAHALVVRREIEDDD